MWVPWDPLALSIGSHLCHRWHRKPMELIPHTHTHTLTTLGISSNSLILKLNLGPTFHTHKFNHWSRRTPTNHLIMTTHVSFKPYLWPTFFLFFFRLLVNELNQNSSPWLKLKLYISKFIRHRLPDNQYINWVWYSWHLLFANYKTHLYISKIMYIFYIYSYKIRILNCRRIVFWFLCRV